MEPHTPAGAGRQFVLDIGTRSVVGIAGHREGDVFVVDTWDCEAHPRRAMIDGQIEDIEQVARVARAVKERMEKKLGTTFTRVSVAAAGRALKTSRACAAGAFPGAPITPQMAYGLENAAVNSARLLLDETDGTPYYCVGHAVVRYMLDGYPFASALGHRAAKAEVVVIATFLPAGVVESLHSCMELLGLAIDTLTLEPIAAMRAVIPQDLRLLNLALADIGAGTSDIAISRDSAVAGYTMATLAGDEITESIIRRYLVDFATAERLKLALSSGGPFAFTDILGFEHTASEAEMAATIAPAMETLAGVIAKKIQECNGGSPPAAVFLVGGGSKTPGLAQQVADALGLPHNKVALAGTHFSGRLLNENAGLDGPEYATPVGIALIAADNAQVETACVLVNGAKVRLFMPGAANVMDALLAAGYRYTDLMGRNGRSLAFTLSGVRTVVRGTPYTAAVITRNGRAASLSTPVENGDSLAVEKAQNGLDAAATAGAYVTGGAYATGGAGMGKAAMRFVVNGVAVAADHALQEGDEVVVAEGAPGDEGGLVEENSPAVLAPGTQDAALPAGTGAVLSGALPAGEAAAEAFPKKHPAEAEAALEPLPEWPVYSAAPEISGSELEAQKAAKPEPTQAPGMPAAGPAPVPEAPVAAPEPLLEPKAMQEAPAEAPPALAGAAGRSLALALNGKNVVLPPRADGEPYHLFDMLTLVDIDPASPKGKVLMLVNGAEATYLAPLASGDRVEIGWAEE